MRVLIENSAGQRTTSKKHAKNYVKRKQAEWVLGGIPTIRFIERDHRHEQVKRLIAGAHYSAAHDALARYDQVRRLPVVGDVQRLYTTVNAR